MKVKLKIYSTDKPNELRVEYKDEVTAGNGAKKMPCLEKENLIIVLLQLSLNT